MLFGAAGLLILALAVSWLVVTTDRRLRAMSQEIRRIHLQQANIIGMLQRAGFRGPKAGPDWGDSALLTRARDGAPER